MFILKKQRLLMTYICLNADRIHRRFIATFFFLVILWIFQCCVATVNDFSSVSKLMLKSTDEYIPANASTGFTSLQHSDFWAQTSVATDVGTSNISQDSVATCWDVAEYLIIRCQKFTGTAKSVGEKSLKISYHVTTYVQNIVWLFSHTVSFR